MKRRSVIGGASVVLLTASVLGAGEPPLPSSFVGATPLQWSVRMADSEMRRRGDSLAWTEGGRAKWDYAAGLFTLALIKLGEQVNDPRYLAFAGKTIGSFITPDGQIRGYQPADYNVDNLNPGKTLLALYRLTGEDRYRKAAVLLRRQLDTHPRTSEGGFWHKQRYPHQLWLDGAYMGTPFYAECAVVFREPISSYDDVARQILLVGKHTFDPGSGLFYHGWDESRQQAWVNPATGASSNFWSRGIGWYAMAIVDDLDFFPADHPARSDLTAQLRKVCDGVVKHQDSVSGLWYQVTNQGGRKGNYLEATASCMFLYAIAKGIERGYLSDRHLAELRKGYQGLLERLVRTDAQGAVTLAACCSVAGLGYGRNGSFEYYIGEPVVENDLKGVGPFILAGLELQRLSDRFGKEKVQP